MNAGEPVRVAYVTTGFPYVSHTFIADEVDALRRLGVQVETFAVRRTDPRDVLTDRDQAALDATFAIRPVVARRLLSAHFAALRRTPIGYLRTFVRALSLGGASGRDALWHLFYFAQAVILWHELDRRGIRHVHAHFANVATDLAMLATWLGRATGQPCTFSFTMHGPTEFADVKAFRLQEKTQAARFVVCISDFCRSQLMALTPAAEWDKLRMVHCGIDVRRFAPTPHRGSSDDDRLRLLCVGRLVELKGQRVLLDAVALLAGASRDVHLTLVGDGPGQEGLAAQVVDAGLDQRVTFMGAVGPDGVRSQLENADVFCLASFAEGVPIVLMEAMAAGVPVIATSIMGIPELIEHGVTGLLVPPGRADALASAVARVADQQADNSVRTSAARDRIVAEYNVDRSALALRDLFTRELT